MNTTKPSDSSVTHPNLSVLADRVSYCADLMRRLRWARGKTSKALAAAWGVPLNTIHEVSAEAWRRVRAEVTDPARAQAMACVELEAVMIEARRIKGDPGAMRVRIEAAKALAAVSGGAAPLKYEAVGQLAKMTPEQHRAALASLREEIEEEERRVEAELEKERVQ